MKNIELKIILVNPKTIIQKLKTANARFVGTLNQIDIYFNQQKGRLKLREINGKNFELIYYERSNTKKSKISNYKIISIKANLLTQIKDVLVKTLGKKVTVTKTRNLWLCKNTRIHIDKVKSLGNYLELETVVKKGISSAKKEHQEIINLLGINKAKKIDVSYSDLLLK